MANESNPAADLAAEGHNIGSKALGTAGDQAASQGQSALQQIAANALNKGEIPSADSAKAAAADMAKSIASQTAQAAVGEAKQYAGAKVDALLGSLGNDFPAAGGILGALAKPIADKALNDTKMPDF